MPDLESILSDPNWFPYEFDADFNKIAFVRTDSETLRTAPFLDHRFLSPQAQHVQFPVQDVLQKIDDENRDPIAFIFHSAFCCSTLMASALDQPGKCLALKEPQILMSLANAKRMLRGQNRPEQDYKNRFQLVMRLLSRRFDPDEHILLKPTNSVNNIMLDVIADSSPAVIMFSSLEDFLISVLKKGEACKSFIRTQYNIFTLDPCVLATIPPRQAMTFTDLQIATLVWRHQLELFFKAKKADKNIASVRDKDFLAQKFETLTDVSECLALGHDENEINKIVDGPVFQRNSKFSDQQMDGTQRDQDAEAIKKHYRDELAFTLKWAETVRLEGEALA